MQQGHKTKVLGIAGYSGSGKTTLLEKVIPLLRAHGLRISVIKHAHHNFDIDRPGKDSFRHREAGAQEVLIVSGHRWALMHELRDEAEPSLDELIGRLSPCDLLLVEGYKFSDIPKLEIHRPATGHPLLHPNDANIIAVVTDSTANFPVPRLDVDAPQQVADHILEYFSLNDR
ncbi:MAG TPA: molybdopterin-guanine dinucleotide biosynthesis protein B [Gallionellaceae bacterium]|nr:molybdopterin-guanine dinucleotide biosynthesis protein B [Gallionellaceae bacterium]